jgi:hypothetical protein
MTADTDTGSHHSPSGTVKIPGFGQVKKRTAQIGAVAAVALVVGYIYVRNRKGSAASSAAAGGTVTDAAGNVCSALDPNSNYCPGSPQDQAYYSNQSGVLPGGSGSGIVGYDQQGNPIYASSTPAPVIGPGSFINNAQWAQYAEQAMGSDGSDTIAAALGKYITGGEVTTAQVTTIDEAIAIAGYPPVPGPGGKPPSINQVGDKSGGGGGGKKDVTKQVPNVVGEHGETAFDVLAAAGFNKVTQIPASTPRGKTTTVTSQTPRAGAKADPDSQTVTIHVRVA